MRCFPPFSFSSAAIVAVLLAQAACATDTSVGPPPAAPVDWHAFDLPRYADAGPSGPTPKERAVADTYAKALAAADLPQQLGAMIDGEAHFVFPGLGDARGRDAVVKAHTTLFGAFDNRAVATSRIWRTDSAQAVEWTMSGVQARDFFGVAPTNKPVVFKGLALLWTKDDGTLVDVHAYFDVAAVKGLLGVGPKDLTALPPPPLPAGPAQVTDEAKTPQEKDNVTTVRAALDALENNNEPAYVDAMADDVEVSTLERAQPLRGKEEAKAYFKSMHKTIAQLDTTLENAWGVGPYAVVEYTITGELVGPLGSIPLPRDKALKLQIVDIVEVHGGKIARVWRYDNPSQIAASSYQ